MNPAASVGVGLTHAELFSAGDDLRAALCADETPDLHLALGLVEFLTAGLSSSEQHLRTAFLGFRRSGQHRRAALAAAHLGRLEHAGYGNSVVAAGWFARALRLLEGDEECVERGWLALGILGCSVPSATELRANSDLALRLARTFGDTDLECRALADSGLALVGLGQFGDGMRLIDEAMTMAHSGECTNVFVTGQVQCSFVSACQRSGDTPRLEGWLAKAVTEQAATLGPEAPPNLMVNHCRTEYGMLLCLAGRWPEAETALRASVDGSAGLHAQARMDARAALAELRIDQGRLAEAAAMVQGLASYPEAQLSIARLHAARGELDLAAAVLRQALPTFAGDLVRGVRLLGQLVVVEIARGNLDVARAAAEDLSRSTAATGQPSLRARAALATARVALVTDDRARARAVIEAGLQGLGDSHWPLLAAELHLALAELLVDEDPVNAAAEARRALGVFAPLGAHLQHAVQDLLCRLGVEEPAAPPDRLSVLTSRERQILALLTQSLSNPEIAALLVISPKTVEHHVGAILRKLNLHRRGEAAVYAATLPGRQTAPA